MEALILAGGLGTRLGSLTEHDPKPMLRFNQKPFLAYLMDYWIEQGVESFLLSVGYRYESIQDYFGDSYCNIPLKYSVEQEPLGTGGAVSLALSVIQSDTFLLLNGDTFFAVDLALLISKHKERSVNVTMSLFCSNEKKRYDHVSISESHEVVEIIDRLKTSDSMFVNGGVYCVEKAFLEKEWNHKNTKKHSFENDDLARWVKEQKGIYGFPFKKEFIDIGTPEDYQRTEIFLKEWLIKKGE